ncbi:Life-span regulatory factor [Neofusicoccum parvum]|nr:Life-span regulatory factor [Neofusicoccum parvum]
MATTHTHHRTPSHPKRSKPAPLKRASKSQTKVPQVQPRKEEEPEDDLMAASFLNFCTVCEKQIIVPNNSILYCSESCRKKDNTKTITFEPSPPPTPYFHRFSFDDVSPSRDIVPPRSPTQAPSKRLSYGFSETSDDEAPEWNEKESKESEATPGKTQLPPVFHLDGRVNNKYDTVTVAHPDQLREHINAVHAVQQAVAEEKPPRLFYGIDDATVLFVIYVAGPR